jgi:hypothetical protein
MIIREINYDETLNIDKSIFKRENWYLMAWGMGDATSATLFLESRSPVPYKILCHKRVLHGIKFILDNYVPTPTKCKEIVVYPDAGSIPGGVVVDPDCPDELRKYLGYPFDQNEIMMSCNGFFPQDPQCMENAHRYGKLKVAHMSYNLWDHVNNIDKTGVLDKIRDYDSTNKDIEEKTCILFPQRGDNFQVYDDFWEKIVVKMKERGYKVWVNLAKKSNFNKEKIFEGTEALDKSELQDLFDYVVRHKNLVAIGQCSGIFHMFKYLSCMKIMFFPDYKDGDQYQDPGRAEWHSSSIQSTPFTKNHIDIKMSEFDVRQLDLIIP